MSKGLLNLIIVFSIIALFAAFFLNPPFKNDAVVRQQLPTPTPIMVEPLSSPTPADDPFVNDPKTSCNNPFFPLIKGKSLSYSLTVKPQKTKDDAPVVFTNTVIEASGSSAIIETKITGELKTSKQTIICRESGVYGFPFALSLFISSNKFAQQLGVSDGMQSMFNNILLAPSLDRINTNKTWSQPVQITGLKTSFFNDIPLTFSLEGQITKRKSMQTQQLGIIDTVTTDQQLKPKFNLVQIPLPTNDVAIQTKLGKDIGLIQYRLKINGDKPAEINIDLYPL